MCSHLNTNKKLIIRLLAGVIAHSPSHSHLLPPYIPSSSPHLTFLLSICLSFLLYPVNWTLATLRCFSHYSSHCGQIALSFRTIALCSLAAPSSRGAHESFPLFCGIFQSKDGTEKWIQVYSKKNNLRPLITTCCTLHNDRFTKKNM